tara:strand:+ start:6835 stop:7452 length:618 start_codon:yes stop_codon:yes gene_type:complete
MFLPPFNIQGLPELSDRIASMGGEVDQVRGDAEFSGYRDEYQPIGLYRVSSTYAAPDYTVDVIPLDIEDSQDGQEDPEYEDLGDYELRAFNLGGWHLEENNLVYCVPVSVLGGKPYLAAIPSPQSGTILSASAAAGESDIWDYEVETATGTVANVRNLREAGNTSTHYQGYARSLWPSFTVKPIATDERVQLIGAYIDVSNLVVC